MAREWGPFPRPETVGGRVVDTILAVAVQAIIFIERIARRRP